MSDGPAVEIHQLAKSYGRTMAVNGLSLLARRAAVTAILGPNGAGKTTTIEICEGYRRPDGGTVRVLGLDPSRNARQLRPRIGVMLQSGGIPPAARASEYLHTLAAFYTPRSTPRCCWTGSAWRAACAPRSAGCPAASSSGCR